jgi:hypothetical protein
MQRRIAGAQPGRRGAGWHPRLTSNPLPRAISLLCFVESDIAMPDFSSLEPEARAFALVGQFLHHWATVESALHECIQTTFKLTPIMNHIICANLAVHDKLAILRTIIFVSAFEAEPEKIKFNKLLKRVGKYSGHRNIIAHTSFQADSSKTGVQFAHIKAKGNYETDPIIWTARRFEQEGCVLDALKSQLDELNGRLHTVPIRDIAYERLLRASTRLPWLPAEDWPVPMRRTFSSALYNFHYPPPPVLLDSDSTTPKKGDQTPENPQEKS